MVLERLLRRATCPSHASFRVGHIRVKVISGRKSYQRETDFIERLFLGVKEGTFDSNVFLAERCFISASPVPHCGVGKGLVQFSLSVVFKACAADGMEA